MDKKEIEELIKKRKPTNRETVTPVDIFTSPESQQTDKTENNYNDNITKQQVSKTENQKDGKIIKTEKSELIKYTTYLTGELIYRIKYQAVVDRKKQYEIIQEALENYFKSRE